MKRYISPDGGYTVDVPDDWRSYAKETEFGKASYQFGTPKNGLRAIFYTGSYSPWLSLEQRLDNQQGTNISAGWRILGESETVINGRRTLILDSSIDSVNIRNYFFKEESYIYSVLFYAFNTKGIPADKQEEFERVMKSIHFLSENASAASMKDVKKSVSSERVSVNDNLFITPKVGKKGLEIENIGGRFFKSNKAGQLLIIKGTIVNNSQRTRSYMAVKGILEDSEKNPVDTKLAYAGNILTEQELKDMNIKEIEKSLNNKSGKNSSNLNVPTQGSVPFMIIFYNFPDTHSKYSVELVCL